MGSVSARGASLFAEIQSGGGKENEEPVATSSSSAGSKRGRGRQGRGRIGSTGAGLVGVTPPPDPSALSSYSLVPKLTIKQVLQNEPVEC
jgi:hypothetical protein